MKPFDDSDIKHQTVPLKEIIDFLNETFYRDDLDSLNCSWALQMIYHRIVLRHLGKCWICNKKTTPPEVFCSNKHRKEWERSEYNKSLCYDKDS